MPAGFDYNSFMDSRQSAPRRSIIQIDRPGEKLDMASAMSIFADTGVELDRSYGPVPINPAIGRYVLRGTATPEAKARAERLPGVRFFSESRIKPA